MTGPQPTGATTTHSSQEGGNLFRRFLDGDTAPTVDDRQTFAQLLDDEEHLAEALVRLRTSNAAEISIRLRTLDDWLTPANEPNKLALQAMASWLAGDDEARSRYLAKLCRIRRDHPVIVLLDRLVTMAIPPAWWDDWEPPQAESCSG